MTAYGQDTRPGGSDRLADEFFLMAHDEATGKPRLAERIAALGLAGALLGELAVESRIELRQGTVTVVDSSPCADELAGRVLEFLKQEEHPTRTWLAFFAQSAYGEVGGGEPPACSCARASGARGSPAAGCPSRPAPPPARRRCCAPN